MTRSIWGILILFMTACNTVEGQPTVTLSFTSTQTIEPTELPTFTPTSVSEPTPTQTIVPTPTEAMQNTVAVLNNEGYGVSYQETMEEMIAKGKDYLVGVAGKIIPPNFDFTRFHFEPERITKLTPNGEVTEAPSGHYVWLMDQDGNLAMMWHVETGALEHASLSVYTDPETGFTLGSILVTSREWSDKTAPDAAWDPRWWEFRRDDPGKSSRVRFEDTWPFNYVKTNGPEWFERNLIHVGSVEYGGDTYADIKSDYEQALQMLKEAILALAPDQTIRLKLGRGAEMEIDRNGATLLTRIAYDDWWSKIWFEDDFDDYGFVLRRETTRNDYDVQVELVLRIAEKIVTREGYIGGIEMVEIFSTTPALGFSAVNTAGRDARVGTQDIFIRDVCGIEKVEKYIQFLGGEFARKNTVPMVDVLTRPASLDDCLWEEHRIDD